MSIPSPSFDEAKPSSPKKGKLSDEGKENVSVFKKLNLLTVYA